MGIVGAAAHIVKILTRRFPDSIDALAPESAIVSHDSCTAFTAAQKLYASSMGPSQLSSPGGLRVTSSSL